jgi:hypothetical protein
MECPVCLEPKRDIPLLACGHPLCETCLHRLRQRICPLCRNKIDDHAPSEQDTYDILWEHVDVYTFDFGGRCLHTLESMKGLIHLSFQLPSLKQLLVKFSQNLLLVRAVTLLVQGRPCQIKINRSTAVIETGGVRTWHNEGWGAHDGDSYM